MALSNDLISQFSKMLNSNQKTNKDSVAYGTIAIGSGSTKYVKIDGSEILTPFQSTTDMEVGERVMITIKDHSVIVTGNISSPAARTDRVEEIGSKVSEFDTIIADKVSTSELEAEKARISTLEADNVTIKSDLTAAKANVETLTANDATISGTLTAHEASISDLEADNVTIKSSLEAHSASIGTLAADNATIKGDLEAANASINELEANKLSAESADLKYATIDFANIGDAAVQKFYAVSGIIQNLTLETGVIVKELVGVLISGDLIKGNTIQADKLIVRGEDGLYYKLNVDALGETTASADTKYQNGLDGSVIIAKSVTAEKVSVSDLVAFGATIGGFKITDQSIYSGTKESVNNTTPGIYLSSDGQVSFGNSNNYVKFYKNDDGTYSLSISANDLYFGATGEKSVEDITNEVGEVKSDIDDLSANIGDVAENLSDLTTIYYVVEEATNDDDTPFYHTTTTIFNTDEIQTLDVFDGAFTDDNEQVYKAYTDSENQDEYTLVCKSSSKLGDVVVKLSDTQADVEELKKSIVFYVQGNDGSSKLTQTELGWTFDLSSLDRRVKSSESGVDRLDVRYDNQQKNLDSVTDRTIALEKTTAYINMAVDDAGDPCIELGKPDDGSFKVRITNQTIDFMQGDNRLAYLNNKSLYITQAIIENQLQIGSGSGYAWQKRSNGNMGLQWVGG